MEDNSPCGTSDSDGKNSDAISDSVTSLVDQSSTDNLSSTDLSDNQQINEGDKTNDTTDVQKIPVGGHDIKEGEAGCEGSAMKSESETDITMEPQRKSHDEEEQRNEDDSEPPRPEPITAPTAALNPVSSVEGSSEDGERAARPRVTWSTNLVRLIPREENETDNSDDQVNGAGENGEENGGNGVDAIDGGEEGRGVRAEEAESNGAEGQNGAEQN